tara:strand:- start:150 stop:572 length:423 start_codon:yes stop_codon:yes gene_type:complete
MAKASVGAVRLIDSDGDALDDGAGRLKVTTEQDAAFTSWETWAAFEVATSTAVALTHSTNGVNDTLTTAKEIVIQTDDANSSYVMVGYNAVNTVANATVTNRKGIKLNGGETLVVAISSLASIFTVAETSGQNAYVAAFV